MTTPLQGVICLKHNWPLNPTPINSMLLRGAALAGLQSLVRAIRIDCHRDQRGVLYPLEFAGLPFLPRRAFVVQAPELQVVRGGHAHRKCQQVFVRLSGQIAIEVTYQGEASRIVLGRTDDALYVAPMVWSRQTYLTPGAQMLVLASDPYDATDYLEEADGSQLRHAGS